MVARLLILLTLTSMINLVSAQQADTRQELLKQRRIQKKQNLQPETVSRVEQTFLRIEDVGVMNLIDVGFKNVYPQIGTIGSGSGLGFGARYRNSTIQNSPLTLQTSGLISFRNYQLVTFQFGKMPLGGLQVFESPISADGLVSSPFDPVRRDTDDFFLYADLRYRNLPQLEFFGLGNDTLRGARSDFLQKDVSYDIVGAFHIKNRIGFGVRTGLLQVDVDRGTDPNFIDTQDGFNEIMAPGLIHQPDFNLASAATWIDYRDHPSHPHLGGILYTALSRFGDRGTNQFGFTRFQLDSRHYLPLGSTQRILAFRFYTSWDTPDGGARVPFYLQQALGGGDTLRGYRAFRFRDTNLIYLSAEYRWEPTPAAEVAIFYDTGKVFPDRSSFEFEHLKKSIGFGFRFKSPATVFLRLDVARSEETTLFHLRLGPSF